MRLKEGRMQRLVAAWREEGTEVKIAETRMRASEVERDLKFEDKCRYKGDDRYYIYITSHKASQMLR